MVNKPGTWRPHPRPLQSLPAESPFSRGIDLLQKSHQSLEKESHFPLPASSTARWEPGLRAPSPVLASPLRDHLAPSPGPGGANEVTQRRALSLGGKPGGLFGSTTATSGCFLLESLQTPGQPGLGSGGQWASAGLHLPYRPRRERSCSEGRAKHGTRGVSGT